MTSEEMNALRVLERTIVRKIFGPVEEVNSWRIRRNKRCRVY